jgi:hypothetical protein
MIKFSRKKFYQNHLNELKKYISKDLSILHITSKFNEELNYIDGLDKLILDPQNKSNIENIDISATNYDLVIITDLFEVSSDIYSFIKNIEKKIKSDGKILVSSVNPKWNSIFKITEFFNLKKRSYVNSYIHPEKISNIFNSLGFENIQTYNRQIFPFKILGVGVILNILLELILGYFNLGIKTYLLYQPVNRSKVEYSKSIIVPAKNEEGNLEELINRIPKFKSKYEIIIACGPSKDNTFQKAEEIKSKASHRHIQVFEQSENGKANAVWEAIGKSDGEVIAILDSDISVDPEELEYFFEVIENGNCDFVNGTRLMYPMEDSAMRSINKIGNRSFQFIISKLISFNLSDTLCGTKVFKKTNLSFLYYWQKTMYVKDPFCDFDLIFSSAYSGTKILEYPVHYRNRKYGTTNISRFRDGWKLLLYLLNSFLLFKTSYTPKPKKF